MMGSQAIDLTGRLPTIVINGFLPLQGPQAAALSTPTSITDHWMALHCCVYIHIVLCDISSLCVCVCAWMAEVRGQGSHDSS